MTPISAVQRPDVTVRSYAGSDAAAWDACVRDSRNGTFLHLRSYMDYHADRFPDASLFVLDGDRIIAALPATIRDAGLHSHAGLTYGGLIVGRDFHGSHALPAFAAIGAWCVEHQLNKLVYKAIPHIYHRMPAEEDLYALVRLGARLTRRDLSTSLCLSERYTPAKGRKACITKAGREGLEVRVSGDYAAFMRIEAEHLREKHGVVPTHSAEEIALLAARFPANIRLVGAYDRDRLLGGVIVYQTDCVCHAQYIGATEEGKRRCALDACLSHVLTQLCNGVRWFDFGISTTDAGRVLDETLLLNKESWGGRSVVYDQYEWVF
ncbi:MAG: GNAT family N-acetyltransferase [Gammaproteobacteria bacterium]|nr:GNAT family N-acetyltransferase [Gammaproteobacteria bacterium]